MKSATYEFISNEQQKRYSCKEQQQMAPQILKYNKQKSIKN